MYGTFTSRSTPRRAQSAALSPSVSAVPGLCRGRRQLVERVVKVTDDDTIVVLQGKKQVKVRIAGIDAPEKKQAFGNRSRQSMASLVHGGVVKADCPKRDRYGRSVFKVWVQPRDRGTSGMALDAGLAQIAAGLAWWYRRYANEQSAEDRGHYESEENEARLRKRGLWQDANPVPPWEWRHVKRQH
jgi:endonuclease YncB( thermonuclease family)